MNKRPYNNESISQYLLGTLSEAEMERFEEMSFTDDEFVDAANAVERDLIDAYVQGQLQNSLAARFEARYLASPLKRESVELARAFYDYRKIAADELSKDPLSRAAARLTLFPFARWRWQWGLVGLAALILAIVSWSVFVNTRRNVPAEDILSGSNTPEQQQRSVSDKGNEPLPGPAPTGTVKPKDESRQAVVEDQKQQRSSSSKSQLVSVVLPPQMRGAKNIPVVAIPANAKQVAIGLELEPNDFPVYRVVLLNQTEGDILWSSNRVLGQSKDGTKMLNIQLPAQRLHSRPYVLQVYGFTESGKTEQMSGYHFRVLK